MKEVEGNMLNKEPLIINAATARFVDSEAPYELTKDVIHYWKRVYHLISFYIKGGLDLHEEPYLLEHLDAAYLPRIWQQIPLKIFHIVIRVHITSHMIEHEGKFYVFGGAKEMKKISYW